MPSLKRELALSLYRWATGRTRSHLIRSFETLGTFPACVLFYHRVASHTWNDWSIPNANFEQHMDWIIQNAKPASLDTIRESQLLGSRKERLVGVTFDDAYGENCEFAIPTILERKIPATYFVTTHYVESGSPFPHDLARGTPLRPNTIAEIRTMAEQGIQIGAHSHTHPDFGKPMSESQLRTEIVDVRKKLQDWTGQPIEYFAFPYGCKQNISQEAIDTVFEAGYKCFVSAAGGVNWAGKDADHLQRMHGDPGMAAFTNWLTFDPRKIYKASPIQYTRKSSDARYASDSQPATELPVPAELAKALV
jgi:peptidoglycan/xylan/chitin deacetylase (PgdA/CDA1 family)